VFTILNILVCVGDYRLTDENIYWPEKSAQLLRYVSDRTGIVSLANFPLIWLFGMRNDVLLWLTGWGFGTFNAFHRWVARIATVQAVVHSIGYTIMICGSGGWDEFLKYLSKHYFWNGELSTIAMCALVAFSLYGIRRSHYEIFLVTHIVLSIVALWTMYYHVEIFIDGEWNIFIWPCLAMWLLDRGLRAARIVAFDWKFWNTRAKVSYDPNSNLIKMEVPVERCIMKNAMLSPGSYYYIYTLDDVRYMHQSHPFTMAYVSSSPDAMPSTPIHSYHRSGDSSECDSLLNSTTSNSPSMVFLIRPYDGFTKRLQEKCLLRPTDLPVLIEGPYGHSEQLHSYTNVLFIVGGTGIAVPLSHLASILSSESTVQSLKIIWAVRQHGFLASVLREFKGLLADERVDMEVHVTRREEAYDDVLGEELRSVRLMTGRPEVGASVEYMAKEAGRQSLAVMACGPARMADEARKASVEMLGAGYSGVEYFEESFKW
jgi:predicted ferric reductase